MESNQLDIIAEWTIAYGRYNCPQLRGSIMKWGCLHSTVDCWLWTVDCVLWTVHLQCPHSTHLDWWLPKGVCQPMKIFVHVYYKAEDMHTMRGWGGVKACWVITCLPWRIRIWVRERIRTRIRIWTRTRTRSRMCAVRPNGKSSRQDHQCPSYYLSHFVTNQWSYNLVFPSQSTRGKAKVPIGELSISGSDRKDQMGSIIFI